MCNDNKNYGWAIKLPCNQLEYSYLVDNCKVKLFETFEEAWKYAAQWKNYGIVFYDETRGA